MSLDVRAVSVDPALEIVLGELLGRREQLLVRHETLQDGGDGHPVHRGDHLARVVSEHRRQNGRIGDGVQVRPDIGVHSVVHANGGHGGYEQLK